MKNIVLLSILVLTSFTSAFAQVEFSGVGPSSVGVDQRFNIVYSSNKQGDDIVLAPLGDDFTILSGPNVYKSSSVSIVNGNYESSSKVTYTYILKPKKTGSFTIDPAKLDIDGKKYESNSITIKVVDGVPSSGNSTQSSQGSSNASSNSNSSSSSTDDLFIRQRVNKASVYYGEPILLTTKFYSRVNLQNISDATPPDLKDFVVQDIDDKKGNIQLSTESVNGKQYQVGTFSQQVLYPQKAGNLRIDASEIEFLVRQRVGRSSGNIFDDFFNNSSRVVKQKRFASAIDLKIKPLPQKGRPANFHNTVGVSLKLKASASQTQAKVNDGITIKLEVSGTGNHKFMSTPDVKFPSDFDTFDPTITNKFTTTAAGTNGTKTFEFVILPRHRGTFTIPPVEVSYFDYKQKAYKTLRTKPITIEVEKGDGEETTQIVGATPTVTTDNRDVVKQLGTDIRYIKTDKVKLKPKGQFLIGSPLYMALCFAPILILLVLIFINIKRIRQSENMHLVKNKKANKMATKRLKLADKLLKEHKHEQFYEEILKANYTYLSDKLYLPVSDLNKDNAKRLLAGKGVDDETISELMEVIDTCEFARFSPSSGESSQMDELYNKAISTITRIDGKIKK